MVVSIGKSKIMCKHVYIAYGVAHIWDAYIPDIPLDFDYDYDFCDHSDGTTSVCVSAKADMVDVIEGGINHGKRIRDKATN